MCDNITTPTTATATATTTTSTSTTTTTITRSINSTRAFRPSAFCAVSARYAHLRFARYPHVLFRACSRIQIS